MVLTSIKAFFKMEAAGSVVLLLATLAAMITANASLLVPYYTLLQSPLSAEVINDGLMAFFFLLVGIELQREIKEGELSTARQALLPVGAALGGIVLPAIIFCAFHWQTATFQGWAIPTATDIAFSLGILALFTQRVPASLRVFLMSVAIIDDIAAVIIIAVFYSHNLSGPALALAAFCIFLLWAYRRRRVVYKSPYLFAGAALWVCFLDAGIHAALAGVVLGLLLPLPIGHTIAHRLQPWVTYGVVPLFAFANAGIPIERMTMADITHVLPLSIAVGLFAGKQVGILTASWLMIRMRLSELPSGISWGQLYGVCIIAGIGFTMSLFIGSLAFTTDAMTIYIRLGVLTGSLASAVIGTIFLALVLPSRKDMK